MTITIKLAAFVALQIAGIWLWLHLWSEYPKIMLATGIIGIISAAYFVLSLEDKR